MHLSPKPRIAFLLLLLLCASLACMGGAAATSQATPAGGQLAARDSDLPVKEIKVTQFFNATRINEVEVTREVVVTAPVEVVVVTAPVEVIVVTVVVEKIVAQVFEVTPTPGAPVSQFSSPGMFLVGKDIEAGTYQIQGECYWARLSCLEGELNCILANANISGQSYVTIRGEDMAFETSGSCSFTKTE